jgi:hypothetical protein
MWLGNYSHNYKNGDFIVGRETLRDDNGKLINSRKIQDIKSYIDRISEFDRKPGHIFTFDRNKYKENQWE